MLSFNRPVGSLRMLVLVILLGSSCLGFAEKISQITRGAILSNSCAACHGEYGKSPGSIPSINGKSEKFLQQVLSEFRSGKRASTIMQRIVKGFSDEEIKLIAQYIAKYE